MSDTDTATSHYFGHTPVMARELVAKALESGEYTQTTGQLTRTVAIDSAIPAGDCCLGVACKVFIKEEPELAKSLTVKTSEDGLSVIYGGARTHLPHIVAEWLDLSSKGQTDFVNENDVDRLTFPEIAGNFRNAVALGRTALEGAVQPEA